MTSSSNNYDDWSREALIERILQLETMISPSLTNSTKTIANGIDKLNSSSENSPSTQPSSSKPRKNRPFDFSSTTKRPIALKIAYLGWEYYGFASLETLPTIESHLFTALETAKLIPPIRGKTLAETERGWQDVGYARCGRTDRGVSSFGQVVNLWLRSNLKAGDGILPFDTPLTQVSTEHVAPLEGEIDYAAILNRLLPPTIRVLGWTPVKPSFSARFSCKYRTYHYFFHLTPDLNLEKMQQAALKLQGIHDYRNFAKVDMNKINQSYTREIYHCLFKPIGSGDSLCGEMKPTVFEIKGSSFLWHQVRNIMAILFLVGQGREEPEIIDDLLNMSIQPRDEEGEIMGKPNYEMADDKGLVLVECGYEEDFTWYGNFVGEWMDIWKEYHTRCISVEELINMTGKYFKPHVPRGSTLNGKYLGLMKRPRADAALTRHKRKGNI